MSAAGTGAALVRRLLAWALPSMALGGALQLAGGRFWRGFGLQVAAWGALATLIAAVALLRGRPRVSARALWIGSAVDLLYVAGGIVLAVLPGSRDPWWAGQGWGVVAAGTFLYFFDALHALFAPPAGSQAFYAALEHRYDGLFPEDPGTTEALAAGLAPGARVLDLACGTGTYAAALARRGLAVTGLDLSAALVERGRQAAGAASLLVGDMRRFRELAPGPFDRLLCIGNSLPHLRDEAEVAALLAQARAALAPGGSLIVATVNFDRGGALTELPSVRAGEVTLRRRYRWRGEGRVLFLATLEEPGQRPLTASVPLLALRGGRLLDLAREAGFARARLAGGFDGGPGAPPHTPEAFLTVLHAEA